MDGRREGGGGREREGGRGRKGGREGRRKGGRPRGRGGREGGREGGEGGDLTRTILVLQMKHFERVYQQYLRWHDTWRIHDNSPCSAIHRNVLFIAVVIIIATYNIMNQLFLCKYYST